MKTKILTRKYRWELEKLVSETCNELRKKFSTISHLSIFTDPVNEMHTAIIAYHE